MNNRFYNHIFKIAEAEAKLQLCDVINEDIATQTMQSIQLNATSICRKCQDSRQTKSDNI